MVASAVRRNVWLDQGTYIVYPHMYVVLVGPPGKLGKSTTMRMARKILLGVEGVNMGPDSITTEELIRQLARIGSKEKSSAMTIHSTELSSLIEPSGVRMIQFLTDIYDGDVIWKYATKGSGRDTIRNPVLNVMGATTPMWIAEGMPGSTLETGFTSRTIFVYEDEPRHLNPFPEAPDPKLVDELTNELEHISKIEGQFEWGPGAKDTYRAVYEKIYRELPTDYRVESYHWRKRTHILKVAMLVSLADSDDLVLTGKHIEAAGKLLRTIEKKMPRTFSAVGKHEHAADLERIYGRIVASEKGMKAADIYEEFYAAGSMQEIAGMIAMLRAMGRITTTQRGSETIYMATRR